MSQRKLIRTAVADGLRAAALAADPADAISAVGEHVYSNRTRPLQRTDLPAIRVYTDSESVEHDSAPTRYVRTADLVIEVSAADLTDGANSHDELDDIAHEVESWMFDREELAETWMSAHLDRVDSGRLTEADSSLAGVRLVFSVQYEDFAPRLKSTPDEFDTLGAEYTLEPSIDNEVDAVDLITLPN